MANITEPGVSCTVNITTLSFCSISLLFFGISTLEKNFLQLNKKDNSYSNFEQMSNPEAQT